MSRHDLHARPIDHHLRESIATHLSIVVAAMAVSHCIERQTGWSIEKFARTARRYRTVNIKYPNRTRPYRRPALGVPTSQMTSAKRGLDVLKRRAIAHCFGRRKYFPS
jgi:hypothetical protein